MKTAVQSRKHTKICFQFWWFVIYDKSIANKSDMGALGSNLIESTSAKHDENTLLNDQFSERARWTESYAVIGYASGQDGAISHGLDTRCVPLVKHKSFIDQACWVKMVWYWPLPFFVFLDPNSVSGYKHANTHPCWLHTWSIAHISFTRLFSLGSCHRNMQSIPTCTSTW